MVRKKENNTCSILIIIFIVLFSLSLLFWSLKNSSSLKIEKIPITLNIADYTAFNLSGEELNLGTVSKGSFVERGMDIINTYPFQVMVEIDVRGNISELLLFDSVVYINEGEEKNILFSTIVIGNESKGAYLGEIIINIRRASL